LLSGEPRALYNEALEQIGVRDISGAIYLLEQCVSKHPDADALRLLGLLYYLKCDFDKAQRTWAGSLLADPGNKAANDYLAQLQSQSFQQLLLVYNEGLEFYQQHQYMGALEKISEVIDHFPELIEPYELQIDCYLRLGKLKEASQQLAKLKGLDTSNARAREFSKMILWDHNRRNMRYGQLALAACLLVAVFLGGNQLLRTMALREALSEESAKGSALRMAYSELEKEHQYAVSQLSLLNERLSPKLVPKIGDEGLAFQEGLRLFASGKIEDALQSFQGVVTYGTRKYLVREALYFLGRSFELLGDLDRAVAAYRSYVSRFPGTNYYDDSLYKLGLILYRAGDKAGAQGVLRDLVRNVPGSIYNNGRVRFILEGEDGISTR